MSPGHDGSGVWCELFLRVEGVEVGGGMMGGIDISTLTLEQYFRMIHENHALGMVNEERRRTMEKDTKDMTIVDWDVASFHLEENKTLDYLYYTDNAKIDAYYDLPPLLPCFKHIQPYTQCKNKSYNAELDEEINYISYGESVMSKQVGMASMTQQAPLGTMENVLFKIDKIVFPCDFVVIDMLEILSEMMILGKPFLATIHAQIDVLNEKISFGIREDRVKFDETSKRCADHQPDNKRDTSRWHVCKHVRVFYDDGSGEDRGIWPTCNPDLSFYSGYGAVYGKEWLKVKIGHTNITNSDREKVFNEWVLDSFDVEADYAKMFANPYSRRFDEYRRIFINEEKCELNHGGKTYAWHNKGHKEEELWKFGIEKAEYTPPIVNVETFEVKRYSFTGGRSFIYITKQFDDALPLGRANWSQFARMIIKEFVIDKNAKEAT
ncbi:phospholipase-like protein [Tanacetum coccineum]|uniref:Phospholipase-like protein n=1 Tax=Tanacetum coccineum TaxID=301880 RepID=A0ABQ4XUC5_9ASTR